MTIKIPCHCQDPSEPGVLHRVDGPCKPWHTLEPKPEETDHVG